LTASEEVKVVKDEGEGDKEVVAQNEEELKKFTAPPAPEVKRKKRQTKAQLQVKLLFHFDM
jgi:hypothetical protein